MNELFIKIEVDELEEKFILKDSIIGSYSINGSQIDRKIIAN
jgi:hypothetical protein